MRLLLVTQEYPPSTAWGGIAAYAAQLAPALARAGHEVHVLSVVREQPPSDAVTADGVHVHRRALVRWRGLGRLTGMTETWRRVLVAGSVRREVRRLHLAFDVIETPEWVAQGLALTVRRPAAIVVRLHLSAADILPFIVGPGLDRSTAVRMEDALARRADVVIASPGHLETEAVRLGLDPARSRAIPCPVPIGASHPLPDGPPVACILGRLEPRKGTDTVIRAWPKVVAEVPNARLLIKGADTSAPGHPSYLEYLRALALELGVDGALDFEREGDRDEVEDALRRATVVAMPSRRESFGLVAAEAAAAGRAVVASDLPPLREIVDDGVTGRLVGADDVEGWAVALVEALSDRAHATTWGEAGTQRVAARFDPDLVAEQTLFAYELALESRGRTTATVRGAAEARS